MLCIVLLAREALQPKNQVCSSNIYKVYGRRLGTMVRVVVHGSRGIGSSLAYTLETF